MDEYTTNDVDKRILRDLLESWNLSCIYNKLDAFGLDIESLTLLNEQDINTIFPKDNEMGIRIKLRDKISKWRIGEVKESPSQSLNVMKRSFSPNTDQLSEPIILPESGMDNSTKIEALFENLTLLELLQALREDPSPNRRDLVCNNIISQMLDMRCLLSVSDFSIISDEIVKRAPNEHKEVFFFYNNRRPSGKLYYKFKNACHNRRKVGLLENKFKRRKMTNAGPSTSSQMDDACLNELSHKHGTLPDLIETLPEEIQIDFYNHSQNENLFEVAMPYYDMDDFKTHFQMSRNSFEELMLVTTPYFNSLEFIPAKQKLLLTLWLLTHRESFVAGGDRFGMAPSSAHIIFTETVDILKDLLPNYVRFPDHAEQIRIASKFRNIYAIPGIIGSIDVCRISIKEPEENSIHFYNQNGVHSIILQAVCDDKLCFTDVHIGMPGRMSIVNVFERSQIYTKLSNPGASLPFSRDHHLVGDKEYPNSNVLITPYDKTPASLTHAQTKFNEALTSAHQVIQKCFINFKSKYKRLEYLDMEYLELSNSVIAACCVLHNFTIQFDGNWTDLTGEEGLDGDYDEMDGVFYDFPDDDDDNGSFRVRDDDDSMCYLRPDKRLLYTSYFE